VCSSDLALSLVFQHLSISISYEAGVVWAVALAWVMILLSGIRAPAYVAILKDALLIAAILMVGLVCVRNTNGGVQGIFAAVLEKTPETLTVPAGEKGQLLNTMTTVFFMMLTLNIYPILVAGTLTSASEKNIRRSVIIMPMYMLMFPFLVIAAYFALINLPGLPKDTAVLAVAKAYLPQWLLGLIAGGTALTAVLVVSVNALSIAGLFSKNIYRVIKPRASEKELILCVRAATFAALALGALTAIRLPNLLANILKMSYVGMAQLLTAFIFAFFWKKATPLGIICGVAAGFAFIIGAWGLDSVWGVNKGCAALAINITVAAAVSLSGALQTRAPERWGEYAKASGWELSGEKGQEGGAGPAGK
jgi:SSS family solute:Na+ symporter